MVAIEPVMRDIGRMFKTDDVRLPMATEIRSLTASSKALTAGPRDVLGEDDRSSISAGGRAGTSEQISKAPLQAYERGLVTCPDPSVRKELPDFREVSELGSELPELESSELEFPGLELPSPRDNYQAAESGYQAAWHDENKTERANATSLEARPGPKLTPLPVQEETEPVGEKVSTPAVTSQSSLASMEKRTEPAPEPVPEPQQAPFELRSSNARTPSVDRADLASLNPLSYRPYANVAHTSIHPSNPDLDCMNDDGILSPGIRSSLEAPDRPGKKSFWLQQLISLRLRAWRPVETRILRYEFQRRRRRGFHVLQGQIGPYPRYGHGNVGYIDIWWYHI